MNVSMEMTGWGTSRTSRTSTVGYWSRWSCELMGGFDLLTELKSGPCLATCLSFFGDTFYPARTLPRSFSALETL